MDHTSGFARRPRRYVLDIPLLSIEEFNKLVMLKGSSIGPVTKKVTNTSGQTKDAWDMRGILLHVEKAYIGYNQLVYVPQWQLDHEREESLYWN